MRQFTYLIYSVLLFYQVSAQPKHLDFVGAGHKNGISVMTSSNDAGTNGQHTVDGFRIQNQDQLKDASRFLAQATFGADYATIEMTAAMGYEAWLEEQFELPQVSIVDEIKRLAYTGILYEEEESMEDNLELPSHFFESAWVSNNLISPDWLRQRMTFALSQIMVINRAGDFFEDYSLYGGNYYEMLDNNSFGSYQNLLSDVTLNISMGLFLSHYNNRKAIPELNIHPDENYAREIMQLFSIGLWELNPNGTRRRDEQGQFIPTYNNADIKEFAQVFTGLSSGLMNTFETNDLFFSPNAVASVPMLMYESYHDTSEKKLLNGTVLPAGQSGMEDINQTIAHLSNHPNTAPFISKQLIQRFTTSNPSAQYVADVSNVFNPTDPNNFKKLLSTILLHPEARTCNTKTGAYTFGKLREPLVRTMNIWKSFQLVPNNDDQFIYDLYCLQNNTGQFALSAPSVFNFYRPDYAPQGPIGQQYKVAPEFQILNSTNVMGIINNVQDRTIFGDFLNMYGACEVYAEEEEDPFEEIYYDHGDDDPNWFMASQDFSILESSFNQPEVLVNYLDIIVANGLLEDDTKRIISNAIRQLESPRERLRLALYLVFISPDYAILR